MRYDAAVVGAGVFGAWIAYRLAQSGRSVLLIDAYGPGNPRSSSGAESRILRMSYGANEVYTQFARRSLPEWKRLGDELFVQTGLLWLSHPRDARFQASRETLSRAGIVYEDLSNDEIRRRYPRMSAPPDAAAILEPESGVLLARKAVLAVVDKARGLGVEVRMERIDGAGRLPAETIVFACGPWLPKIFPGLLGEVITPTRQEVYFFGPPAGNERFRAPHLPAWIDDTDPRIPYGMPDIDGHGVKVAFHREGPLFDPDGGDRFVLPRQVAEAREYLAARLPPMAGAPLVEARVCQYENTPSGDFLIDRHPEFDNVWLVGGGSGHGFKHGPAVAEYVTGRIEGRVAEEPRFSLAAHADKSGRTVV